MSDPIQVGRFWTASGLDPGKGLRQPMLAAGMTSLRAYVNSRTPRFEPTIRGCFRYEDYEHMLNGTPGYTKPYKQFNLTDYSHVRDNALDILDRVSRAEDDKFRMPRPPDEPWSQTLIDLFLKWIYGGMPP